MKTATTSSKLSLQKKVITRFTQVQPGSAPSVGTLDTWTSILSSF
ncbi:hypothetical protein [Hymenobacter piscis]|nr:hypothetical protein [Hymenobacter piscis]